MNVRGQQRLRTHRISERQPHRRRRTASPLPVALFAALLLLLTGCLPRPHADPKPDGTTPLISSAVLGELRTVDPCSLIEPSALSEFGRVRNAGTVSLDYCLLHVRTPGGTLLQLAVGELRRVDAEELTRGVPVRRVGGLRIVRQAPLRGHCSRQVLFSDGVAMQVNADLLAGDPSVGLCAIAQAGARRAAEAILGGAVTHRRFPENSLAWIDPCTLLPSSLVHRVPGLENARARSAPARHQCGWGGGSIRKASVRLLHTAGAPPRVSRGTAVEERIAGRRTVVGIIGDPQMGLCSAETAHIPFGEPRSGMVEVAMLVVYLPESDGIRACEFARGLAEHVWPRLPER